MKNIFVIFFLSMIFSGCANKFVRGQVVEEKNLAKIKELESNSDQVLDILGTPTIISDFDRNTWFYFERLVSERLLFKENLINQRTVIITFDEKNIVKKIDVFENSKLPDVSIERSYTPAIIPKENLVTKFFRNIGRFNAKSSKPDNKKKNNKKRKK